MHLVASRTKQNQIAHVVILTTTIQVSDFQYFAYPEAAMGTVEAIPVLLECKLSIV